MSESTALQSQSVLSASPTSSPAVAAHPIADVRWLISDSRFIERLDHVRDLKRFLFEEQVQFSAEQIGSIDLEALNNLQYSGKGRAPTDEEWRLLDEKLSVLASYLTPDLRRRILLEDLGIFFNTLPLLFLLVAVVSTVYYMLYPTFLRQDSIWFNTSYLCSLIVWTLSQGGLGACAYLGTTVAIRKAETSVNGEAGKQPAALALDKQPAALAFDIADPGVMKIRIILGALFAFLIGVPISFQALEGIRKALFMEGQKVTGSDLAIILTPFLLGFSMNLVLAIIDRCLVSVQVLLGLRTEKR